MDSNEKKDKIDWDAPTEAATLSQIEGEMERLRGLVNLMENDGPLEDRKEKGITLLYEYMGQLFLLHSEVEKLGYLSFVGVEGEQADVDKFCNNDVCEIPGEVIKST